MCSKLCVDSLRLSNGVVVNLRTARTRVGSCASFGCRHTRPLIGFRAPHMCDSSNDSRFESCRTRNQEGQCGNTARSPKTVWVPNTMRRASDWVSEDSWCGQWRCGCFSDSSSHFLLFLIAPQGRLDFDCELIQPAEDPTQCVVRALVPTLPGDHRIRAIAKRLGWLHRLAHAAGHGHWCACLDSHSPFLGVVSCCTET